VPLIDSPCVRGEAPGMGKRQAEIEIRDQVVASQSIAGSGRKWSEDGWFRAPWAIRTESHEDCGPRRSGEIRR
jgi:hypothetical protein